jgi:integrase
MTLVLAGPRIAELCALDAGNLDTAESRLHVAGTKTDAAERVVPLVPALREVLIGHRLDLGIDRGAAFPTRNGTRQTPDNLRVRILESIRVKANELLGDVGRPQIDHMTPHTLRRTFASILAICDVPRSEMARSGHRGLAGKRA